MGIREISLRMFVLSKTESRFHSSLSSSKFIDNIELVAIKQYYHNNYLISKVVNLNTVEKTRAGESVVVFDSLNDPSTIGYTSLN